MLLTALIVTERPRFFHLCEGAFNENNVYVRLSSSRVRGGINKPESTQPDILLVDVAGSENSIEFVDRLMKQILPCKPALFICLDERDANWEKAFLRGGAMYVFEKSMPEHFMVECVMSVYDLHCSLNREEKVMPELVRVLRECRVSPRHRGYSCIADCVRMMIYQNDGDQLLTKKIYPQVAAKQGTTSIRVEKNIRDAIRGGWESGGKDIIPAMLGCGKEKPPTNGEFISCVCEKLMEVIYERERAERGALIR